MCLHAQFTKHGYARNGQQRLRCRQCRATWSVARGVPSMVHRISPEKERLLASLIDSGLTDRQIMARTGCSHITIQRRRRERGDLQLLEKPKARGLNRCDYCGNNIDGEREAYRLTRRTKHKFCNHVCYGKYQRLSRLQDRCKRCKRMRKDIGKCVVFSYGWCPACYGVLYQFGFDEEAAALFELTQRLKKEVRHGKKPTHQATY